MEPIGKGVSPLALRDITSIPERTETPVDIKADQVRQRDISSLKSPERELSGNKGGVSGDKGSYGLLLRSLPKKHFPR